MFMFYLFCMIGWVQESTIESIYHRRPINRGFLRGPYIPIYGVGGMTMLIVCVPFKENGFAVYFVGMVSCTLLEYFVGWLMETLFHKQFWDYSMLKLTYKNRISLVSSLFWGLLSLFMVYILYDIVSAIVSLLSPQFITIFDMILLIAMSVDTVISIAQQTALREKLKKLPYEKAKKLMIDNFIRLGGAVMKRRERFNALLSKMRFSVEETDVDNSFSDFRDDNDEEGTEETINEETNEG